MSYRGGEADATRLRDRLRSMQDQLDKLERLSAQFHPGAEWQPIANATLGGSSATISFSGVPQTFAHLMVVAFLRSDFAAGVDQARLRVNGDAGAHYDYLIEDVVNATPISPGDAYAQTAVPGLWIMGALAAASRYALATWSVPDYATTVGEKVISGSSYAKGSDVAGGILSRRAGAFWRSTAAINTLTVSPVNGANFVSGSRATLYGLA